MAKHIGSVFNRGRWLKKNSTADLTWSAAFAGGGSSLLFSWAFQLPDLVRIGLPVSAIPELSRLIASHQFEKAEQKLLPRLVGKFKLADSVANSIRDPSNTREQIRFLMGQRLLEKSELDGIRKEIKKGKITLKDMPYIQNQGYLSSDTSRQALYQGHRVFLASKKDPVLFRFLASRIMPVAQKAAEGRKQLIDLFRACQTNALTHHLPFVLEFKEKSGKKEKIVRFEVDWKNKKWSFVQTTVPGQN